MGDRDAISQSNLYGGGGRHMSCPKRQMRCLKTTHELSKRVYIFQWLSKLRDTGTIYWDIKH